MKICHKSYILLFLSKRNNNQSLVLFVSNLDLFNGKFWSDTLIRDMCFEAQIQEVSLCWAYSYNKIYREYQFEESYKVHCARKKMTFTNQIAMQ